MPEPTMPPITSMVASNRPSLRAKPDLEPDARSVAGRSTTWAAERESRDFSFRQGHTGRQLNQTAILLRSKIFCPRLTRNVREPAEATKCPNRSFAVRQIH